MTVRSPLRDHIEAVEQATSALALLEATRGLATLLASPPLTPLTPTPPSAPPRSPAWWRCSASTIPARRSPPSMA